MHTGCAMIRAEGIGGVRLRNRDRSPRRARSASRISISPPAADLTCFTFHPDDRVDVEPLKISMDTIFDLEDNLLLFFTGFSRSAERNPEGSEHQNQEQR